MKDNAKSQFIRMFASSSAEKPSLSDKFSAASAGFSLDYES